MVGRLEGRSVARMGVRLVDLKEVLMVDLKEGHLGGPKVARMEGQMVDPGGRVGQEAVEGHLRGVLSLSFLKHHQYPPKKWFLQ